MKTIAAATLLALALPAGAGAASRELAVPADKSWMHAETKLILRPHLAGLARLEITDATNSERDVTAHYQNAGGSTVATLYLFHPAAMSVPMWFDRSQVALEDRNQFQHASPASSDPVAFALPGSATPAALRQTYSVLGSKYRSTSLAILPLGEWIVAVRMSAEGLGADQLDALLQQMIGELKLPATSAAPPAVTIKPCAHPLTFAKAKVVKSDGADMLLSLLAGSMVAQHKVEPNQPPPLWCRDGAPTVSYGVYRANADEHGYVLALFDSGRTATVSPGLMTQMGKGSSYSVSFADVDGTVSSFPSFNALPRPEQLFQLITHGQSSGTARGNQVNVNPGAFKK